LNDPAEYFTLLMMQCWLLVSGALTERSGPGASPQPEMNTHAEKTDRKAARRMALLTWGEVGNN
jgi:hypothetical protein